jgi:centromere protein C
MDSLSCLYLLLTLNIFVSIQFYCSLPAEVVSYYGNMEGSSLPPSSSRTKQDGKVVGKAAQAFNIPNDDSDNYAGYIMGNLRLPPKGIKDAESVGPCSQTFTVCECQPKALEVAYGDPDLPEGTLNAETAQRFYMSPGDLFRVPPGNCYRLQNHSKTTNVLLTWTIIRPRNLATSS